MRIRILLSVLWMMDTLDITDIYMQRPQSLAVQGLGEWFCAACGVLDKALVYSTSREAKRIILDKYTGIPEILDKCRRYNFLFQEK